MTHGTRDKALSESKVLLIPDFRSEYMDNERRIFVYLPPGYDEDLEQSYPVLYMHAGQRIFQQKRPTPDTWNIHLTVDRLIREGLIPGIIVVGIAHFPVAGTNEFLHPVGNVEEEQGIRCTGSLYESFIIEELIPYVNREFRTLTGPEHTALMGSSAAALFTYHTGLRRPDVFGMIGLLSPYFIINESAEEGAELKRRSLYAPIKEVRSGTGRKPSKVWLDIGTQEGLILVQDIRKVAESFLHNGWKYGTEFLYYEIPGGGHEEKDWGQRAYMPIVYFFGIPGDPVSVTLHGETVVGLQGGISRINPVVDLDNGIRMTDLTARYQADPEDMLHVEPDGRMIPYRTGTSAVTYSKGGLEASCSCTVIPELSEEVEISIRVEVPPHTPENSEVYAVARLSRVSDLLYAGKFKVPRGAGFQFRISRGFRLFETDREKNERPYRTFIANGDMELSFVVEDWIQ